MLHGCSSPALISSGFTKTRWKQCIKYCLHRQAVLQRVIAFGWCTNGRNRECRLQLVSEFRNLIWAPILQSYFCGFFTEVQRNTRRGTDTRKENEMAKSIKRIRRSRTLSMPLLCRALIQIISLDWGCRLTDRFHTVVAKSYIQSFHYINCMLCFVLYIIVSLCTKILETLKLIMSERIPTFLATLSFTIVYSWNNL